jgi:hypothetical protein
MLKTVSSITNAIGALNFKGTWDANANSPALASSVGTKGDYYVVGTAGSTNLNGISNWGIGDLATFNGSVWQRVEGGADLNGVNLSVSGTSTLSGLTASTALALDASKNIVSVTNTGTGNNVLATVPSFASTIGVGGATAAASGAGITFPATVSLSTDPNTLDDYEEGSYTPSITGLTLGNASGQAFAYVKVGNIVTVTIGFVWGSTTSSSGVWEFSVPFAANTGGGGAAYVLDNGTAEYMLSAGIATVSFSGIKIGTTTTGFVSNTQPMTWTTNDRFSCCVTYRV